VVTSSSKLNRIRRLPAADYAKIIIWLSFYLIYLLIDLLLSRSFSVSYISNDISENKWSEIIIFIVKTI